MNDEPQTSPQRVPAMDTNTSPGKPVKEDTEIDYDRRGKPLPPRQRVGGIITPQ